jgi:hypothetical protein
MGGAEYEKLQNMWARDGNRCRWAVAFPIVETFDIPDQPDAAEILGRASYLRLFAHPANLLRPLTDDERAKLAELTIMSRPASSAWIAIEDETAIALRDEPAIPANIKRNIEIDLNRAAMEGISEERRVGVRTRAAWNAWKFVRNRQSAGRLTCDDCGFNPSDRIGDKNIKPRSLLDVHHRDPLSEGVRYTRPTDEFFRATMPKLSPLGTFGALGLLSRIRLDLMLACLAPHDQADAGRHRTAKGHRRAGLGFHPRRRHESRGGDVRHRNEPNLAIQRIFEKAEKLQAQPATPTTSAPAAGVPMFPVAPETDQNNSRIRETSPVIVRPGLAGDEALRALSRNRLSGFGCSNRLAKSE